MHSASKAAWTVLTDPEANLRGKMFYRNNVLLGNIQKIHITEAGKLAITLVLGRTYEFDTNTTELWHQWGYQFVVGKETYSIVM